MSFLPPLPFDSKVGICNLKLKILLQHVTILLLVEHGFIGNGVTVTFLNMFSVLPGQALLWSNLNPIKI